jgi:hypothetical protein
MRALDQINLQEAEAIFAAANTPLFLLRELRSTEVVRRISSNLDVATIFRELKSACGKRPKTIREAVLPYVLLCALSLTNDETLKKKAAHIAAPYYAWYYGLAQVLITSYTPTSIQDFRASARFTVR